MVTHFKRILILDDDSLHNVFCILLLKKHLQNMNMDIVGFLNPLEGLTYINNEYQINPVKTILFLDINMPLLNGWQVLDKLKQMNASVIQCFDIYILSSSISDKDVTLAKGNQMIKAYLEKPLSNHLPNVFSLPPNKLPNQQN